MTPWWLDPHWWVNAVAAGGAVFAALGTIAVAFVAVFGDWIKRRYFPPRLKLEPGPATGSKATSRLTAPSGDSRYEESRYYHVSVRNDGPLATDVGVYLILVKFRDAGGDWYTAWTGKSLLSWPQTSMQPFPRSVGKVPVTANVIGVIRQKWLELMVVMPPLSLPFNSPPDIASTPGRFREAIKMVVGVQAIATEGESDMLQIYVAWDRGWADGDIEIVHHIVFRRFSEAEGGPS